VGKAQALGAIVYAVGGIEEHVHIAVSVPPKIGSLGIAVIGDIFPLHKPRRSWRRRCRALHLGANKRSPRQFPMNPKISLADFVGQIKGAASHHINHLPNRPDFLFDWQRGYGVVSFGQKDLDRVIEYVRNQKEHHQRGDLIAGLERADELEDAPSAKESQS
jgi:REP element-mobilizing transposase RayT